jgi:CheY-like chemotaxis protein
MRVAVISYDSADAASLTDRLRREGFDASAYQHLGQKGFRDLRAAPPDAILIDLMRMPSYGRAMGALLRESKPLRTIPLVFLEGDPEKTERVRTLLPDAGFATLPKIGAALRKAGRGGSSAPIVPKLETALAQKLKVADTVRLVGAPDGFIDLLPGVRASDESETVLLFVRSAAALGRDLSRFADTRRLWVLWPKKASGIRCDLTLPRIHEACGALGLVAYKTCSVDETWSGAAVARRRG